MKDEARYPVRRTARLGALLASGLALAVLENTILPWGMFLPVPGAKLGLANLATLVALEMEGFGAAAAVAGGRVLLVAVFTGTLGAPAFWLSLGGAVLSLFAMGLVRHVPGVSVIGTSMVGAVSHNLGQFLALGVVLPGAASPFLLPWLVLLGLPAGLVTGWLAKRVVGRLMTTAPGAYRNDGHEGDEETSTKDNGQD
ncbi:MAG: Gx transporter family protein [Firmicutes bacterium]|nr:Gx transporter family protein [Bacillota bacterium]